MNISPPETSIALRQEIARRRTFAIVSHPDAGKTTLTEKFLLYGGALHLAGAVKAGKNQRSTTSDWMELEQKRGISISSAVLQFEYRGFQVNLLDTPGHNDFSEDTYRVLTAVDAAVMVIDASKGIENQTRKLFDVCRKRGVPIFTFINKLDRPSLPPLALLDEIEEVLGIATYPMNWPLGTGFDFKGVWDRQSNTAHLYERTPGGAYRAPVSTAGLTDPAVRDRLDEATFQTVSEEVELLDAAGAQFDLASVSSGAMTPVYFGSALNNFGVQLLLDGFLEYSPPPGAWQTRRGIVEPEHEAFSGFIFKIQSNMNLRHRDQIAYMRIVSGRFERDMNVHHARSGKKVRLSNTARMFGHERETLDVAFPGDVVGIVDKARFIVGDTLTEDPAIEFDDLPRFQPECFTFVENPTPSNFKRFRTGLEQLVLEGVAHRYDLPDAGRKVPLLGAVGPLQFEILQHRLEHEYGAPSRLEAAPWNIVRWTDPEQDLSELPLPHGVQRGVDTSGRTVLFFPHEVSLRFFQERNPKLRLHTADVTF